MDKEKMVEFLSIQQLDIKRKIEITRVTISKLPMVAQHLDMILKIRKPQDDMGGLGYIIDQVTPFICPP